eukprot:5798692-Pyramimonas_sp.AAC.1
MDASWTLPWASSVVATDASEEGFGATVSYRATDKVAQVGRIMERDASNDFLGRRLATDFLEAWRILGRRGRSTMRTSPTRLTPASPRFPTSSSLRPTGSLSLQ